MKKISREDFIKTSSLALLAAFNPPNLLGKTTKMADDVDQEMMHRLVKENDQSVERLLGRLSPTMNRPSYRGLSSSFAIFAAAYSHPESKYYESEDVIKGMQATIDKLLGYQYPDGTLDSGGNRKSPPDTAFLLDSLCPAASILKEKQSEKAQDVQKKLDKFLLAAGEGIRTGGVHTPNHRWEICKVLAKLYKLYGDKRYVDRIDEWLAEGIYQNEDGNYPERSRNYAVVENEAFIVLGEILNRPDLHEIVSKNLSATYYYIEDDGEMVCLDSRRQDQFNPISSLKTYFTYRYMAIQEKNEFFASITREIESLDRFQGSILSRSLHRFMSSDILKKELPGGIDLPEKYTKHLVASDLVRIKRGNVSVSIFGGNDLPLTVASGRSCNPTFFTFRKGSAILEYARLSTSFFNTGYVRGHGLKKDGNRYELFEKKEAYYYHPMPKDKQNKHGDYKLSPSLDTRFWSKMDFESRPKTTVTQESKIVIEEIDDSFLIHIEVTGVDNVAVTLDLCFRDGGSFEGATQGEDGKDYFLDAGHAKYSVGNDTLEIGPGKKEHTRVHRLDGEVYTTHFGSIKGKGQHLYITGIVPFKHSITIK